MLPTIIGLRSLPVAGAWLPALHRPKGAAWRKIRIRSNCPRASRPSDDKAASQGRRIGHQPAARRDPCPRSPATQFSSCAALPERQHGRGRSGQRIGGVPCTASRIPSARSKPAAVLDEFFAPLSRGSMSGRLRSRSGETPFKTESKSAEPRPTSHNSSRARWRKGGSVQRAQWRLGNLAVVGKKPSGRPRVRVNPARHRPRSPPQGAAMPPKFKRRGIGSRVELARTASLSSRQARDAPNPALLILSSAAGAAPSRSGGCRSTRRPSASAGPSTT